MAVDRCICHDVPFARVKRLLEEGLALPQIVAQTGCGTGCGLCRPYVRCMMVTGHTVLPIMSPEQCAAWNNGQHWPMPPSSVSARARR